MGSHLVPDLRNGGRDTGAGRSKVALAPTEISGNQWKYAEIGGSWRKLAEIGRNWQKLAEIGRKWWKNVTLFYPVPQKIQRKTFLASSIFWVTKALQTLSSGLTKPTHKFIE